MAGLGPAIYDLFTRLIVDARPKAGHDEVKVVARYYSSNSSCRTE